MRHQENPWIIDISLNDWSTTVWLIFLLISLILTKIKIWIFFLKNKQKDLLVFYLKKITEMWQMTL